MKKLMLALLMIVALGPWGYNSAFGQGLVTGQPGQSEFVAEVERVDTSPWEIHLRESNGRARVVSYYSDTRVIYRGQEYSVGQLEAGDIVAVQLRQDSRGNSYTDLIRVQESIRDRNQSRGGITRPGTGIQTVVGGEARTLELVDRLKDAIRKAENRRNKDPQLVQELRDLVRRYDWPWRVTLLYDDFRDGDYTANPSWVVDRGDFRVTRGFGLRTVFTQPASPPRGSSERRGERSLPEIIGGMIDDISGWAGRETERRELVPNPPLPSVPEISTALRISNSFAVQLQMTSRGRPENGGRLEFGPYQGRERNQGYRLVYIPGERPAFALVRIAPGRSSVIEVYDQSGNLEDGRSHGLEWRRGTDGEMVVLLDDKEIIRTSDRASGESFEGFTLINGGGDYAFSRIAIFGSQQ